MECIFCLELSRRANSLTTRAHSSLAAAGAPPFLLIAIALFLLGLALNSLVACYSVVESRMSTATKLLTRYHYILLVPLSAVLIWSRAHCDMKSPSWLVLQP